ncbi:response regulator [Legionella cincinnatiensis]|uniref:Two-component response regulator n=1 Tax=Legionella cincinnatiensis TaxID=28085 RepID=A0A378IN24_9GAMM|nr:response regulator [Legionella cincinnatiensis]KTC78457.1 two-component response regulator [Legionella cincinnatiensis]STX36443.1 two-component response regulator [Legionella cincinnatiensis]
MPKELKKILYAEDEEDIRAIAQIALEDIGDFTVKYCSNGKEVIDAAKEFIPDLLLLDVMMPEQDGPTTLFELRKNPEFMEIPAIFMTAKIQSDEIAEYKSIGAIDVIKKPFDPLTLAMSINDAWLKYNG